MSVCVCECECVCVCVMGVHTCATTNIIRFMDGVELSKDGTTIILSTRDLDVSCIHDLLNLLSLA